MKQKETPTHLDAHSNEDARCVPSGKSRYQKPIKVSLERQNQPTNVNNMTACLISRQSRKPTAIKSLSVLQICCSYSSFPSGTAIIPAFGQKTC